MTQITTICFDGDDTLWAHETYFEQTKEAYHRLMSRYDSSRDWRQEALKQHVQNLPHFGYGVKAFTIAMVEIALALTDHTVAAKDIQKIMEMGRKLLRHPVTPLPHVQKTIETLSKSENYKLMIITKGDLVAQQHKITESGLESLFEDTEIVVEKDAPTYKALFERHNLAAPNVLMIGNSVKSDILPVLELGAQAIHVPFHVTWDHEIVEDSEIEGHHFLTLHSVKDLPKIIAWHQKNPDIPLHDFADEES